MTKTLTRATAFALAIAATFSTFAATSSLATHQFVKAEQAAASDLHASAVQTVVVIGHRHKA